MSAHKAFLQIVTCTVERTKFNDKMQPYYWQDKAYEECTEIQIVL